MDRLEHVRGRTGLLGEVMELAYGPRRAGILMLLGLAMARWPHNWDDHPTVYESTMLAALAVLVALRPAGTPGTVTPRSRREEARAFYALMSTVRGRAGPDAPIGPDPLIWHGISESPPSPSWADTETIRALLGPLLGRIDEPRLQEVKRIVLRRLIRGVVPREAGNSRDEIADTAEADADEPPDDGKAPTSG